MAPKLFKLVIDATTTTTVDVDPVVTSYFYEVDDDHRVDNTLVIPANAFVDEDGNQVADIVVLDPDNGYYLLFVNGVLQQSSLYTVTANDVTINDATSILEGTPIVLVASNFTADATSDTTVTT